MNFPSSFSVKIERVYDTSEYIAYCKEGNCIPTREGFFEFISDELDQDFPMSSFDADELIPHET